MSQIQENSIRKDAFRIVIKRLREKNNYTQSQLSALSGISRQHISFIESKGAILNIATQECLAKAFNISLVKFFKLFNEEYEKRREIEENYKKTLDSLAAESNFTQAYDHQKRKL